MFQWTHSALPSKIKMPFVKATVQWHLSVRAKSLPQLRRPCFVASPVFKKRLSKPVHDLQFKLVPPRQDTVVRLPPKRGWQWTWLHRLSGKIPIAKQNDIVKDGRMFWEAPVLLAVRSRKFISGNMWAKKEVVVINVRRKDSWDQCQHTVLVLFAVD